MKTDIKVSVIVLAYRSASTILQTLDSIKNQNYANLELIITDDCSSDETVKVCQEWLEWNEKFFLNVHLVTAKKNTGIPGNINRALKVASGVYVKLIAADDILCKDAITRYVSFFEKNPDKLPIAKVKLFCPEKESATFDEIQEYCDQCYEFAKKSYDTQYQMLLKKNCIVAPSASCYPISALRKTGGYDESLRWFEDYPMNLKLMHEGYSFGLIDEELVHYRMSSDSITASNLMRLKKTEMKFYFKTKFWYMVQAGMGWEAIKQCKYWLKILFTK